ncbi:MAG TPA: prolyl oligopeptidase family serine peptidase [Candidatus Eisenbacteria bacterium]|nr:prolyl oligopeptidase family serine peptidase [Candidatus Eisenbacteria bacterium]
MARARLHPSALACVALAIGIGGCSLCRRPDPPPGPPAERTGPPSRVHQVFVQGRFVEITIEVPLEPPGPKPAVISYIADARVPLLEAGIVVVSYRQHWELLRGLPRASPPPDPKPEPPAKTYGTWLLASPTPKTVGQSYFRLIDANATGTLPQVLDAMAGEPEIDPTRIGILGHSTNAFVALQGVAGQPRIRVAAIVAGCGDYHTFLHESSLAMKGEPLDLDPAYSAWLREREVRWHPRRVLHAAVFMVNGRDDDTVPADCARTTARALRRAYRRLGAPERFRFVLVDSGHTFNDAARAEVYAWLRRWLVDAPR